MTALAVGALAPDERVRLTLAEHSRSEPVRVPSSARRALFSVGSDRVRLLATADPEAVVVETTSWVGTVSVPGFEVRIVPRVPMASIFAMLGGQDASIAWGSETSDFAGDGELLGGSALVVLRAVEAATRRGLLHGYRTREEESSTLRGRLLVDQLARRPWTVGAPVCRFEEFTSDVVENHLLRAAVVRVLGAPGLSPQTRRLAVELLARFDGVADADPRELALEIPLTRLNAHYEHAMGLARLAIDGFSIRHDEGERGANAFLVDVDLVFLRFVATELRARLWPAHRVEQAEELALDDAASLRATADILVRDASGPRLVIGTRYHLGDDDVPRRTGDPLHLMTGGGRDTARTPRDPAAAVANDAAAFFPVMVQAASLDLDAALVVYAHARRRPASRIRMPATRASVHSWHVDLDASWRQLSDGLDDLAAHVRRLCG